MSKTILALASAAAVLVAVPALAATGDMKCSDADMTKMNGKIDSMSAGDSKTMAMKHMGMAKDSMAQNDMKACAMHMKEAMAAMEKK